MRSALLLVLSAICTNASEYATSPPPPPIEDWDTAKCMARVLPIHGKMVNGWEIGNGAHAYEIHFLVPDWREGQEVSVELGSTTTRVTQCSGAISNDYFYETPGTLRFRLGTETNGNDAHVVSCQMEGTFEDAIISYHGTFCFVSPPPPPHLFAACDRLKAEGFEFHVITPRGTGWEGAVHLNNWQPGAIFRMDFGGAPFQVNEVTYAEKGVRAAPTPTDARPLHAPLPDMLPSPIHGSTKLHPADVH